MANWITANDITDFIAENFCLTGKMQRGRKTLHRMIERRDGSYEERVNKWVTVLVVGSDAGSKLDEAERRGIRMMTDTEFMKLLQRVPEVEGIEDLSEERRVKSEELPTTTFATAPRVPAVGTQLPLFPEAQEESPAPAPTASVPSTVGEEEATAIRFHDITSSRYNDKKDGGKSGWKSLGVAALVLLVIVSKAALLLSGLSLAIVLWLIGIPVNPTKL